MGSPSTQSALRSIISARKRITGVIGEDAEYKAALGKASFGFSVRASNSSDTVVFSLNAAETPSIEIDSDGSADFTLVARNEVWEAFLAKDQPRFHHSFWSILRTYSRTAPGDVYIEGSHDVFSRYARVWRLVLDHCRDAVLGITTPRETSHPSPPDGKSSAAIQGNYVLLNHPSWGHCNVYYDSIGNGSQPILLLHTAGADSRQNHAFMLQAPQDSDYTIFALDLPSHGRSYPIPNVPPQGYALTEDDYVTCIDLFIRSVLHKFTKKPIVCGASMAGHVCLALAIRAAEIGIAGVIPLEAAAHLPLSQPLYEVANNSVNESVLNAERVYSMLGPSALWEARQMVWWTYASQAPGIFQGDLAFYFGGWDGRSRLGKIDVRACPVVMGTGEWDYSCTAEVGRETAEIIGSELGLEKGDNGFVKGVRFEVLKGLGHFPLTEDPERMWKWVDKAVKWIVSV